MKAIQPNKPQVKAKRKHMKTSNSVDKRLSDISCKHKNYAVKSNCSKVMSKRNTSIPKAISIPIKKTESNLNMQMTYRASLIEMDTARIFIELLRPFLPQRKNGGNNSLATDDSNKSNRESMNQGVIYKKTHPVFKSKVYGQVVKQFSQFLPKRIELIPTQRTVITSEMKLAQMIEIKAKNCLSCIFFHKARPSDLFLRLHRVFDEEILCIYNNFNSLYAMYIDTVHQRDIETLNGTLVINKTNSSNSTIQGGILIKTIKSENTNNNMPRVNINKLFDIGLTPFPAKKHKSNRFDYEFITASRAANLIRRIEYSNYVKYCQPKSKDDFILSLNSKAVMIQRWWRQMLTNNTFYYKIITIQRMYRGHIIKAAFNSAKKSIKIHIPFFSQFLFTVNKAMLDHSFNKLLCYFAYLYQYTLIHEKQLVIIRGFRTYKLKHWREFNEMNYTKSLFNNNVFITKQVKNIICYKQFINKVIYLQSNIVLCIRKHSKLSQQNSPHYSNKGKVINFKSKTMPSESQICIRIIDEIKKYANRQLFIALKQYIKPHINNIKDIKISISQKEIMIKLIGKSHLHYCFNWLKKQIQRNKLTAFLALQLIKASLRFIALRPSLLAIVKSNHNKISSHRSNKSTESQNELYNKTYSIKSNRDNPSNAQIPSFDKDHLNKKLLAIINKIPYLQLRRVFDIYCQRIGKKRNTHQEEEKVTRFRHQTDKHQLTQSSPLFLRKNKYAIYCSLRKIIIPLIQKRKNAFYIYFTKFVIAGQKQAMNSLKDSNVNFSFNAGLQNQNQANTIISQSLNSARYATNSTNNKFKCFIIANHFYFPMLRNLFVDFIQKMMFKSECLVKAKAIVTKPLEAKSKLVELCLKNIIKTSNTCKKTALAKYFMRYHSIVYLTQLNDLYLLSTTQPSLDLKGSFSDSNHELPSNILRMSIQAKKNAFENKAINIIKASSEYYAKLLRVYFVKWKNQIVYIRINSLTRIIQRNWRLKLSPKQKLALMLRKLLYKQ